MNYAKKLLAMFFIAAGIVMSFAFIDSAKEPSNVILIRGYMLVASGNVNTIKIYHGSEPVEIIELEKAKSKEAFDQNISKILETVNQFTEQGYEVVAANEFGGNAVVILDFTLAK